MLVLMLLLIQKGRKHPRSMVLALYALVEVISNGFIYLNFAAGWEFFVRFPLIHFIYKPIYCLWAPLFYIYFRYCLSQEFRASRKQLVHFVPFLAFLILFITILLISGNQYIFENLYAPNSNLNYLSLGVDTTVKFQYLIYNFLMIRRLVLTEGRVRAVGTSAVLTATSIKWLRFIAYGYTIGCSGLILDWVLNLMGNPLNVQVGLVSITYFFIYFFFIFYSTISQTQFSDRARQRGNQPTKEELEGLMVRIDKYLIEEKKYLDSELTLQQIAQALEEKERNVSQAINMVRKRNVNDYINHLRVEHACRLLLESKDAPIFEVMYSSGFSTKGAFNLAFKRITGLTPTQFRESSRG